MSATILPAAGSQPVAVGVPGNRSVAIHNPSGNSTIYWDTESDMTSSTGIPIVAGQTAFVDLTGGEKVYVVGTENDVVRYVSTERSA